jgi:hypothetical protein
MQSSYVIVNLGSSEELAVDGRVANAQLSRGEDSECRCFGVASSDSVSHMLSASFANSSSTPKPLQRNISWRLWLHSLSTFSRALLLGP